MQFFELVLIIVASIYILFLNDQYKIFQKPYSLVLLLFTILSHIIIEGYRWQMIPAYLLWGIALLFAIYPKKRNLSIIGRFGKWLSLLILFCLSIAIPSILPVFRLPQPTGSYGIGTLDKDLQLERAEIITDDETDKRKLALKIWYPTSQKQGEIKDKYVDKAGRDGFAIKYGIPPFILNYLDKINTHVYRDTEIVDQEFPVLIFSHGYNSKANGYYAMLSEVVSHGYIIIAINHTYESTGSTFSDQSEAYFDYTYQNKINEGTYETIIPTIQAFEKELSFEQRHPIVKEGLLNYYTRDMEERWAEDFSDVISHLGEWNKSGDFKGKLDLSNVGVFGHSRGGGSAGVAMLEDNRIKAGVNIDGVQWGQIVDTIFQKPFLFISADWPDTHQDLNQHAYINKSTSYFYKSKIKHSAHSNFMDIPIMIPMNAISQAGSIDPVLALEITNKLTISFFDKHLKNSAIEIESFSTEYENLELEIFRGDSIK